MILSLSVLPLVRSFSYYYYIPFLVTMGGQFHERVLPLVTKLFVFTIVIFTWINKSDDDDDDDRILS